MDAEDGRGEHSRLLPPSLMHSHQVKSQVTSKIASARRTATIAVGPRCRGGLFALAVCGDEVQHSKPAPDVYVECARQLRIDPQDVLVLEDAPSGVRAAAAAGMRVVVVPSVRQRGDDGASLRSTSCRSVGDAI